MGNGVVDGRCGLESSNPFAYITDKVEQLPVLRHRVKTLSFTKLLETIETGIDVMRLIALNELLMNLVSYTDKQQLYAIDFLNKHLNSPDYVSLGYITIPGVRTMIKSKADLRLLILVAIIKNPGFAVMLYPGISSLYNEIAAASTRNLILADITVDQVKVMINTIMNKLYENGCNLEIIDQMLMGNITLEQFQEYVMNSLLLLLAPTSES